MKILIIGNGFDLNLGLKTSYKDFLESEEFRTLVTKENNMALYFKEKQELNNWVDIEREITNFSNSFEDDNFNIKEDFSELKKALMNYLKKAQEKEINQNSKAFKVFKEEIKTIDLIFNFNYTDSVFKIADLLYIPNLKEKNKYIHGSIENSDIIFGVEDEAKVQKTHKFFKKSYNHNHGEHKVKEYFNKDNEIVIFGHSLGITDSTYFKDYINSRSILKDYKYLTFYYYGEAGWDEMYNIIDDYTSNSVTGFRANNFKVIDSSK